MIFFPSHLEPLLQISHFLSHAFDLSEQKADKNLARSKNDSRLIGDHNGENEEIPLGDESDSDDDGISITEDESDLNTDTQEDLKRGKHVKNEIEEREEEEEEDNEEEEDKREKREASPKEDSVARSLGRPPTKFDHIRQRKNQGGVYDAFAIFLVVAL